jgi:hypothetical protein
MAEEPPATERPRQAPAVRTAPAEDRITTETILPHAIARVMPALAHPLGVTFAAPVPAPALQAKAPIVAANAAPADIPAAVAVAATIAAVPVPASNVAGRPAASRAIQPATEKAVRPRQPVSTPAARAAPPRAPAQPLWVSSIPSKPALQMPAAPADVTHNAPELLSPIAPVSAAASTAPVQARHNVPEQAPIMQTSASPPAVAQKPGAIQPREALPLQLEPATIAPPAQHIATAAQPRTGQNVPSSVAPAARSITSQDDRLVQAAVGPIAVPALEPTPAPPDSAPRPLPAAASAAALPVSADGNHTQEPTRAKTQSPPQPSSDISASAEKIAPPQDGVPPTPGAAAVPPDPPALTSPPAKPMASSAKESGQQRQPATANATPANSPAPQAPVTISPSPQNATRDAAFQPHQSADTASRANTAAASANLTGTSAASATPTLTGSTQAAQPAPSAPAQAAAAAQPPVAQLAGAVANLHVGADGTSHVTIRLDPAELGHLQIRISRATDGTTSVDVAVERPDTLANLQTDLGHLHQALDRAGLPDQRSLTMHLASQPDQAAASNLGTSAGFTSQGGQQGARQQPQQPQAASHSQPRSLPDTSPTVTPPRAAAIAGKGVNITA